MNYPIDSQEWKVIYEKIYGKCDDKASSVLEYSANLINTSYECGLNNDTEVVYEVDDLKTYISKLQKGSKFTKKAQKLFSVQVTLMKNAYLQGKSDANKAKTPCGTGIPTESI